MIDWLKVYFGEDIFVTDKISIHQPTIKEIVDVGEIRYLSFCQNFTAHRLEDNIIVFLDEIGIDFSKISDWDLFVSLVQTFPNDVSKLLFPDINFSTFKPKNDENGNVTIVNDDGVVISEPIYKILVMLIRKLNNLPKPQFTKIADNERQKRLAIKYAKMKIEKEKQKSQRQDVESFFMPVISFLNTKYTLKEIEQMKIFRFWENLKRNQCIKNADHLYYGLYSGCLTLKENPSLQKEMDYLRNL